MGGHLEGQADLLAALADADAADGVAVEVERDEGLGALGAEVGVASPLDDPEEGLVGPACAPPCTAWPSGSSGRRRRRSPPCSAGKRRAVVEAHRDVGPEVLLDRDGAFGGQLEQAAVEVRAERHARLGDLRPGRPG